MGGSSCRPRRGSCSSTGEREPAPVQRRKFRPTVGLACSSKCSRTCPSHWPVWGAASNKQWFCRQRAWGRARRAGAVQPRRHAQCAAVRALPALAGACTRTCWSGSSFSTRAMSSRTTMHVSCSLFWGPPAHCTQQQPSCPGGGMLYYYACARRCGATAAGLCWVPGFSRHRRDLTAALLLPATPLSEQMGIKILTAQASCSLTSLKHTPWWPSRSPSRSTVPPTG